MSGGMKVAANQPITNDWSNANVRRENGIKYTGYMKCGL